jgi:hypothetical protein
MTPEEKQRYDMTFDKADEDRDGYITGEQVRPNDTVHVVRASSSDWLLSGAGAVRTLAAARGGPSPHLDALGPGPRPEAQQERVRGRDVPHQPAASGLRAAPIGPSGLGGPLPRHRAPRIRVSSRPRTRSLLLQPTVAVWLDSSFRSPAPPLLTSPSSGRTPRCVVRIAVCHHPRGTQLVSAALCPRG